MLVNSVGAALDAGGNQLALPFHISLHSTGEQANNVLSPERVGKSRRGQHLALSFAESMPAACQKPLGKNLRSNGTTTRDFIGKLSLLVRVKVITRHLPAHPTRVMASS